MGAIESFGAVIGSVRKLTGQDSGTYSLRLIPLVPKVAVERHGQLEAL
jgi:hypothetical protein